MVKSQFRELVFAAAASFAMFAAAAIPLPEHPRPDWERADWVNLNGEWRFRFDKGKVGLDGKAPWFAAEDGSFDRRITVPFGWGAPLSGVENGADVGWYRRDVAVPAAWKGKRVFLVLGASDRETTCWLGSSRAGTYLDGYTPAEFELTPFVKWGETQKLTLRVDDSGRDWALYGKQGYGNARGIWQTAYLEARGESYLDHVDFIPDLANGSVTAAVTLGAPASTAMTFTVEFKPQDRAKSASVDIKPGQSEAKLRIKLRDVKLWELDNPYLYETVCTLAPTGAPAGGGDRVSTYFGMRELSVTRLPGTDFPYVALNGKPVYLQLTLDQSYHPTGFYTFPSDEFMKNEILLSKKLGLNGNRVHIKAEIPRKLYWADRLGLLIMADVPCAWGDAGPEMFRAHEFCFRQMLRRDFNHPSIFSWVLFNETWGLFTTLPADGASGKRKRYIPDTQRRVAQVYRTAKALDPTRLVEDNSPCNHDHVASDLNTWHGYCPGYAWEHTVANACANTRPGSRWNYAAPFLQGDVPMMNSECGNVWGYAGSTGDCDFTWDYHLMIDAFRRHLQCNGWLYTEHHDVTNEWNGYVRFDRTPKETGIEDLFPGMSLVSLHADAYLPLDPELCRDFAAGDVYKVPVDVSLTTERHAGRKLTLKGEIAWSDALGGAHSAELPGVLAEFTASSWQCSRIADVPVRLPGETACGVIRFTLLDGETPVARNFTCFTTRGPKPANAVSVGACEFVSAKWSQRQWNVLGGMKACGAGEGAFEYEFALPAGAKSARFVAEVGSKRLYAKDATAEVNATADLGFMLGGGNKNRSFNPNSYPQTSSEKWPCRLGVSVNGVPVQTITLPDDPADHRGILSWAAQTRVGEPLKKKNQLRDAGSYGYLVDVEIPAEALARSADGKVKVRLEGDRGLAVYGAAFGRYPLDPTIVFSK